MHSVRINNSNTESGSGRNGDNNSGWNCDERLFKSSPKFTYHCMHWGGHSCPAETVNTTRKCIEVEIEETQLCTDRLQAYKDAFLPAVLLLEVKDSDGKFVEVPNAFSDFTPYSPGNNQNSRGHSRKNLKLVYDAERGIFAGMVEFYYHTSVSTFKTGSEYRHKFLFDGEYPCTARQLTNVKTKEKKSTKHATKTLNSVINKQVTLAMEKAKSRQNPAGGVQKQTKTRSNGHRTRSAAGAGAAAAHQERQTIIKQDHESQDTNSESNNSMILQQQQQQQQQQPQSTHQLMQLVQSQVQQQQQQLQLQQQHLQPYQPYHQYPQQQPHSPSGFFHPLCSDDLCSPSSATDLLALGLSENLYSNDAKESRLLQSLKKKREQFGEGWYSVFLGALENLLANYSNPARVITNQQQQQQQYMQLQMQPQQQQQPHQLPQLQHHQRQQQQQQQLLQYPDVSQLFWD